jgi:glycosyltransferase involved in cell wall biosynthesis
MKKIILDARYLNRPGMGINTYLVGLISALRAVNFELVFLVDTALATFQLEPGESTIVLPSTSRLKWEQWLLPKWLKYQTYDIYIEPSNFGLPIFFRKRGRKFVLVVHDYIPLRFPFTYLRSRASYTLLFMVMGPLSLLRADLVLTNSEFTKKETQKLFHKRSVNGYIPMDYALRKKQKITKDKNPYFLYNGGADPRKKVDLLIKGFGKFVKNHSVYRLIIIGKGYDKYQLLATSLNIPNIEFKGYVSDEERDILLTHATAVVITSKMEGFGLPVIEAFKAGTPVVCTRNSALEEISGDAAIYIDKITPHSIHQALLYTAELDQIHITSLIKKGYTRLNYFENFNSADFIARQINKL